MRVARRTIRELIVLAVLLGLLAAAHAAVGAEFIGKVTAVIDADTIRVANAEKTEKVRLRWIDAPEMDQPYGPQAREIASDLLLGRVVVVRGASRSYDRLVGVVWIGELNVNRELVILGAAWADPRYATKEISALEAEARKRKLGLWSDPVPPWVWRKKK